MGVAIATNPQFLALLKQLLEELRIKAVINKLSAVLHNDVGIATIWQAIEVMNIFEFND